MAQTIVIDTNVFIENPNAIFEMNGKIIIIPVAVIEELDDLKRKPDLVGKNARQAIRNLIQIRELGSLSEGVALKNGSTIVIDVDDDSLDLSKPDNKILSSAINMIGRGLDAEFLSNDFAACLKSESYNVPSTLYSFQNRETYHGSREILVRSDLIDELYKKGRIKTPESLYPNEYICLQDIFGSSKSALARYEAKSQELVLIRQQRIWSDIEPKNREQTFAINALMDDGIPLVTMTGQAGSGKTLLSLAAALEKVLEKKVYKSILLTRPIVPINRDIGYLPGEKEEKVIHWLAGFTDNAEYLLGDKETFQMYVEKGIIELEAFTYMRGRNLDNKIILVDESQNATNEDLKTIITRVGSSSKIILMGDISQIDQRSLDMEHNGLSYVIDKFKDYDVAAHVELSHGVRSRLSELAASIL